jgi:hypothetical protein
LALLPVVAAPVGAVPGTRHVVWQVAACELHVIMQLVTFEVCATRILPAACTGEWHNAIANSVATNKRALPPQRTMHFLLAKHHSAGRWPRKCAGAVAELAG